MRHLLSPNCQLRCYLAPLAEGCIDLCGSTAVDAPVNDITAAHVMAAAAVQADHLAAAGARQARSLLPPSPLP